MVNSRQIIGLALIGGAGYLALTQLGSVQETPTMLASGLPSFAGAGGDGNPQFTFNQSEPSFNDTPQQDIMSKKDDGYYKAYGGGSGTTYEVDADSGQPIASTLNEPNYNDEDLGAVYVRPAKRYSERVGTQTYSAEPTSNFSQETDFSTRKNVSSKKDNNKKKEKQTQ